MQSPEGPIVEHVFSHSIESGKSIRAVVESVGAIREVKFVAQFVGSFLVYTRLEAPSLGDAQKLLSGPLWEAGVHSEASTEIKVSRVNGPKRASPPFCALVRVRASGDPFRLLDNLDDAFEPKFDREAYWYGAAVVSGKGFDVLVDLGRPSFTELWTSIVDDLRPVEGILGTDSSFAYLPGNAISA